MPRSIQENLLYEIACHIQLVIMVIHLRSLVNTQRGQYLCMFLAFKKTSLNWKDHILTLNRRTGRQGHAGPRCFLHGRLPWAPQEPQAGWQSLASRRGISWRDCGARSMPRWCRSICLAPCAARRAGSGTCASAGLLSCVHHMDRMSIIYLNYTNILGLRLFHAFWML